MSYKDKFSDSEHKAHDQNIATKIVRDMSTLRSLGEKSPIAPRRWIWELIQNAKDVNNGPGVRILIEISDNQVVFKHTGKPFSADNIRFLIEQVSSKDREKDEDGKRKSTGKFGTGFLTTHLLSETVTLNGVAKEPELDYVKFKLELDRSGYELAEILESVKMSKEMVDDLDERKSYSSYNEQDFNTEFIYPIQDKIAQKVLEAGLNDLDNCIVYTLAFTKEIKEVTVIPLNRNYENSDEFTSEGNQIRLVTIDYKGKQESNKKEGFTIAFLSKEFTIIAVPIVSEKDIIKLLPISEGIPRLFCDFPLIGTEVFNFPVIINNFNFNPTDARDGIWLTSAERGNKLSDENKSFILEAVELYFDLLDYATENNWINLHLLALIKPLSESRDWLDDTWYNKNVLVPVREKLLKSNIIVNSVGDLTSFLKENHEKAVWFPDAAKKEIRSEIWRLANDWFPYALPRKEDIELWHKIIWKECGKLTVRQFATFLAGLGDIKTLKGRLETDEVYKWLNDFYTMIKNDESDADYIFNHLAIFPDQNGDFCLRNTLSMDDGTIGKDFKDILAEFKKDIRGKLLDENITSEVDPNKSLGRSFAVREITSEINEKANDRKLAKNYKNAFKMMLLWIQDNKILAEELFPHIFSNKHLLYDDEEIMESLEKADQLTKLLKEADVIDIDALRELLASRPQQKSILPITESLLMSMGISSLEQWQEAIKDKNLEVLFSHESTPTTDMFVYVQGLIGKAKAAIIAQLKTMPDTYDLKNIDELTAPTVLAGILKNGQEISIVARPAYDKQVIIYYGSERDVLHYEPSELWIDDGELPHQITLGYILKSANIIKFPI